MQAVNLRRTIGFILFWISAGMLLMLLIENKFIGIIIIMVMMLMGYNFYYK